MADIDGVTQEIATQDSLKDLVSSFDVSKASIKSAFDTYVPAAKNILKWCESATPLFNQLIANKDDGPSEKQNKLLVETLKDGIAHTWNSRQDMINSAATAYNMIGVFKTALTRITENENLKNEVQNLNTDAVDLKSQFEFEIQMSGSLERQMQETNIFLSIVNKHPEIYDEILASVERLLARCDGYRQRHG